MAQNGLVLYKVLAKQQQCKSLDSDSVISELSFFISVYWPKADICHAEPGLMV